MAAEVVAIEMALRLRYGSVPEALAPWVEALSAAEQMKNGDGCEDFDFAVAGLLDGIRRGDLDGEFCDDDDD